MKIDRSTLERINERLLDNIKIMDRILTYDLKEMIKAELAHARDQASQSATVLTIIIDKERERDEREKSKRK